MTWSKKGLTSSYPGVTAHFTITLAVRKLTSAHTTATVRNTINNILSEWDIDPSNICTIVTNNGSNMLAAFKKTIVKEEESDTEVEEMDESTEVMDEEQEFLDCEEEHDLELGSLNRISCFSHTLQLVVCRFDKIHKFKELMKHCHSLVQKVNSKPLNG